MTDRLGYTIKRKPPSDKRAAKLPNGQSSEIVLPEAGVMLAVAFWLFGKGASRVAIHPDGMHAKQFDISAWLGGADFVKCKEIGANAHGGIYGSGSRTLEVSFKPGQGDVVAALDGQSICVETKGGCVNSNHSGQLSQLRSRMYEAVGSLFNPPEGATRLIAAVPAHRETRKLAKRMATRCHKAGIEIALVEQTGKVRLEKTHTRPQGS